MGRFMKFDYKSRKISSIKAKVKEETLDKSYLGEMKLFYRGLSLSRRDILEWMRDILYSYNGDILVYDGEKWIKFEVGENDLDETFGTKIDDEYDDHLYSLECRFISDWLNQDLPKQNGHDDLLKRFQFMSIAKELYQLF